MFPDKDFVCGESPYTAGLSSKVHVQLPDDYMT